MHFTHIQRSPSLSLATGSAVTLRAVSSPLGPFRSLPRAYVSPEAVNLLKIELERWREAIPFPPLLEGGQFYDFNLIGTFKPEKIEDKKVSSQCRMNHALLKTQIAHFERRQGATTRGEFQIYLNAPIEMIPGVIRKVLQLAEHCSMPASFRVLDYSEDNISGQVYYRRDKAIIRVPKAGLEPLLRLVVENQEKDPQRWGHMPLPEFVAEVAPGIGYGSSKVPNMRKLSSATPEELRGEFAHHLWLDVTRALISAHPSRRCSIGRTAFGVFTEMIDRVLSEEKKSEASPIMKKAVQWQLGSSSPAALGFIQSALGHALPWVLPVFQTREILRFVRESVERIAPRFCIDPRNPAVDSRE